MSPAAKSKSKSAAKAAKEQSKMSPKLSSPPSNGNGISASAYNPVSGTFHSLETMPPASVPSSENNGKFRTIDDTEDHSGNSFGTTTEYDSMSNNGSCSGESEDQKEKTLPTPPPRMEPIPGADTEKRDKIRQKNEKKHQRQRERRAQELHERCSGYLMSRKLEALAQQLVSMGFSSEQATMALMLNEGRVEESVAWLLEGGEESKQEAVTKLDRTNLKIDIADEFAKMADMEVRFKCNKQEVERAVVSCEGDLEKAADILKLHKQETAASAAPPKLEEPSEAVALNNGSSNKVANSAYSPLVRTQLKGVTSSISQQQRDLHYAKSIAAGSVPQEVTNRNLQSFEISRRLQPKLDMLRPQAAASLEKRWLIPSSSPSASYSLASPLQVAATPAKSEARFAMVGNEVNTNLQAGTLREPVIVMQRPQSINGKQNLSSTIGINGSPPTSTGWYPNEVSSLELKVANGGLTHNLPKLLNGSSAQPYYPQSSFQPFVPSPVESGGTGRGGGSWSTTTSSSSSSPLAVPSSLGLFTGWGSSGSSVTPSAVDWSTGSLVSHFDYSSIDWSLDPLQLKVDSSLSPDTWSASLLGMKSPPREMVNGGGMSFMGLQDGGNFLINPSTTIGSHEWTSPFTGRDLFRVPRQFVTSPSL